MSKPYFAGYVPLKPTPDAPPITLDQSRFTSSVEGLGLGFFLFALASTCAALASIASKRWIIWER